MTYFTHFNFNVLDLEKSLKFYEEALGLREVRRKEAADGSFILVYLGDGETKHQLELTKTDSAGYAFAAGLGMAKLYER